jgi:Ca-activated chloride channel family protein
MIEFINTSWWPLSLICFVLIIICWLWSEKKRKKTLSLLLSAEMASQLASSACSLKRMWRNILYALAFCLLLFALLRPFSGIDTEERQQSTRDIMVLFDISNSMNVVDAFGESRLKYGKSLISKLVKELPADRFGLMSFSGLAFLECPMTSDTYSYETALDDMNSAKIPLGGTNIEIALNQALSEYSEAAPHKAIILLSDGEEIGGDYSEATEKMKEKGIKVVTVQVGDENRSGSVRDSQGKPLRDKNGQLLTSQADSKVLNDVAAKTGGIYLPFNAKSYSGQQLNEIVAHVNSMTTGKGEKETISKPREIYQPFLLAAIILLLARMLIGERRKTTLAITTISLIFFCSSLSAQKLPNDPMTGQPYKNKVDQKSDQGQIKLNQLKNSELALLADTANSQIDEKLQFLAWYNLGINLSKQHKLTPPAPAPHPPAQQDPTKETKKEPSLFERATQAYSTASNIPQENLILQSSAVHNRAALFHQEARKIYLQDPDKALEHLEEASSSYRQALSYLPGNKKSATNLELTYLHKKDAELAKEMLAFHQQAANFCGQALMATRALRDSKPRSIAALPAINKSLKETDQFLKKALKKANDLKAEQHIKLYPHVSSMVLKSANDSANILQNEGLLTATEKNIAEAYKLLGGNPEKPEDQENQDQKDQDKKDQKKQDQKDQDKKDQKKQDQKDQDKKDQKKQDQKDQDKKDQKKQDQKDQDKKDQKKQDQKDQDKKLNDKKQDGNFEKKDPPPPSQQEQNAKTAKVREAEALLRKMGDTEKKVREYIRQQKTEAIKKQLREKGIYIDPESNK